MSVVERALRTEPPLHGRMFGHLAVRILERILSRITGGTLVVEACFRTRWFGDAQILLACSSGGWRA